jgi:glycine dehydrogenase subunit 2
VVRHYTKLSQKNYAIDMGVYPLGSCTMKHNPRLNEKVARLPGIGDLHPMQPVSTVQGALELIDQLAHWLKTLTNMPAVAMSPAAGAHGELCGIMTIRAALLAKGDARKRILVPESAHGTNPGDRGGLRLRSRSGARRRSRPRRSRRVQGQARPRRRRHHDHQPQHLRPVRERHHRHRRRGALRGRLLLLRRRQLQRHRRARAARAISASTPCTSTCTRPSRPRMAAAARAPARWCCRPRSRPMRRCRMWCTGKNGFELVEQGDQAFGRLKGFHGQMGMFVRALSYMMSHGSDGLRQARATRCSTPTTSSPASRTR